MKAILFFLGTALFSSHDPTASTRDKAETFKINMSKHLFKYKTNNFSW